MVCGFSICRHPECQEHAAQKVPEYCSTEGARECTAYSDTQSPEHSLMQGQCNEGMRLGQQQQQ